MIISGEKRDEFVRVESDFFVLVFFFLFNVSYVLISLQSDALDRLMYVSSLSLLRRLASFSLCVR